MARPRTPLSTRNILLIREDYEPIAISIPTSLVFSRTIMFMTFATPKAEIRRTRANIKLLENRSKANIYSNSGNKSLQLLASYPRAEISSATKSAW